MLYTCSNCIRDPANVFMERRAEELEEDESEMELPQYPIYFSQVNRL